MVRYLFSSLVTYSALDLSKIEATGLKVPDWEESLKAYVTKELNK